MTFHARLHVKDGHERVLCGVPRCSGKLADIATLPNVVGTHWGNAETAWKRLGKDRRLLVFVPGYLRKSAGRYELTPYARDAIRHGHGPRQRRPIRRLDGRMRQGRTICRELPASAPCPRCGEDNALDATTLRAVPYERRAIV